MILTAATIVMLLVTMTYSFTLLNEHVAENEFAANKQYMRTVGLQIDDIAWAVGRTQEITYSNRFGFIQFQEDTLKYTFEAHSPTAGWTTLLVPGETGIIMYSVRVDLYSPGNGYFETVLNDGSFIQNGSLVPVSQVFCIEKLPMANGSYTRVVAAPTIRMLKSTIPGDTDANSYKFYLPSLVAATANCSPQSLSLAGNGITKFRAGGSEYDMLRINVTFPKASWGFDNSFFNFESTTTTIQLDNARSLEFYVGKVSAAVGAGG
jgi:hypothetical protein